MNTRRRILAVDDEAPIREVIKVSLEGVGGHEVCSCATAAEALARVREFRPDLLLLDAMMPDMNGSELLQLLRKVDERLRTVPAVFLTAWTQARAVEEYRALGAIDVIAKPFDPMELCARIEAALSQAPAPNSTTASAAPAALLADDDVDIRHLVDAILKQEGFVLHIATDGGEALRLLDGPTPTLAILDILMPVADGLQVLEELRARPAWKDVPVLMLTGRGDEEAMQRAFALGATDYLVKPFDPAQFAARVRRLRRPTSR